MKPLFTIAFLLLFGFISNAQSLEIVIDGKPHTITIGKEYKYVNTKGDTVTYFVKGEHADAPKYAKTEFDKAEKVAVPKTQPTPVAKVEPVAAPKTEPAKAPQTPTPTAKVEPAKAPKTEPATAAKAEPAKTPTAKVEQAATPKAEPSTATKKDKIEKLPIGQSKKNTAETASALLGKAYRFDDMGFDEKTMNTSKKLALVKVSDAIATSYPSLEFLPDANVAFCYNQPVTVYHGDEEEFKKLNTTMKVCKDGSWSESDNKLQLSLNLENRNKKINYDISEMKGETLVMEKKNEHVF